MITPSKEFLEVFKKTDGALSVTESIAIMNIAAQSPKGTYIELGSYKGKSATSALQWLRKGVFYLVDPEFSDTKFRADAASGILSTVSEDTQIELIFLSDYSINYLPSRKTIYAYVFVDSGSHQDGLPMQEVKLLEDRLVQNGIIAFHDFRSQFIEVEQAYNYLLGTGKYEEIKIDWQPIIDYVNENNLEEGNKSWHHNELKNPCFVGALKRK